MGNKRFTNTDLIVALNLHNGNVSRAAEELGVSRAAIIKRRKTLPAGCLTKDLKDFRQNRADIFAELQKMLLMYITPEKLAKASIQQIGTLFGIMYDKERLEQNLATEHIAHAHYEVLDDNTKRRLEQLTKELTAKKLAEVQYEN
jgi:hypothetical protein